MIKFLKKVPLFADLDKANLKIIAKGVKVKKLSKGELLFSQGSSADKAYIIKSGELNVIREIDGREILLAVRKKGELIGEIALLEESPRTATIKAATDCQLLSIDKKNFENLLKNSFSATKIILKTVLKRWQNTENLRRESEKMAQLGMLTAGIAHELNNPSAAVQRGTKTVTSDLKSAFELHKHVLNLDLTGRQNQLLEKLKTKIVNLTNQPTNIDPIKRSEEEDKIETWLDKNGIIDASDLAVHVLNAQLSINDLRNLNKQFEKKEFSIVIHWLCKLFGVYNLLYEINLGSSQISDIVKALKSYIYLDQGPVQPVDVHKGIEDTLIILKHKLKSGMSVKKYFDKNLPMIEAHGSELNQVWTNIIDNAIDAMEGKGVLTIRTNFDKEKIKVEIEDNGAGIPKKLQSKIFDPFFTTKELGKGTGLGLDIAYNIVTHKHKGDISFVSRKGKTVFTVTLPRKLKS